MKDGEEVVKGQELAPGVVSRMDGVALYRFPRRVRVDYLYRERAALRLPLASWVEREAYKPGEVLAELSEPYLFRAEEDGVVELREFPEGALLYLRQEEVVVARYLLPVGMTLLVVHGEIVEKGQPLAEGRGLLRLPRHMAAKEVEAEEEGETVYLTFFLEWTEPKDYRVAPHMNVVVPEGARVQPGEKIVAAIDPEEEVIAEAEGVVHLHEPASLLVVKARVYPFEDDVEVSTGDRVAPGDVLADGGKVKSEIYGRVEVDLVRSVVRVVESYDIDARMGAEAIQQLLKELDLEALEKELLEEMKHPSRARRAKARKRLEVVRAFLDSGNRPEWMVLEPSPSSRRTSAPWCRWTGGASPRATSTTSTAASSTATTG